MANHRSAKKRIRRNTKRQEINKDRLSRIRTFIKRVRSSVEANDKEAAQSAYDIAKPEIQKGVAKGVIHKNAGARTVARLNAQLKKLAS